MAATIEARFDNMEKTLDRVLNQLNELDKPVSPGRATDSSISYFEADTLAKSYSVADLKARRDHARRFGAEIVGPHNIPGYKPKSLFKSLGQFLQLGIRRDAEFNKRYGEFDSLMKTALGMNTLEGADGGWAVLPEFAPNIYDRVYDNDIWSRTDNYTIAGSKMIFPRSGEKSRANGSRAGGITGYWVDEGATITASQAKLAKTEVEANKLAVVVYLTEELVQDNSYALEQWVTRKVAEEFNFLLALSVFRGSGAGQPLGFLNSPTLVTVSKESGQTAATINAKNILNMWSRRISVGSQNDLVWLINQDCEPQLHQLSIAVGTAGGQVVYTPPGGLSATPYATLMGRPVIPSEFCSTLGTVGDIALVNLKDYVTVNKGGITEASSVHVQFLTDQTALRFILRAGGRPMMDSPITPYQGTATQSSFIVLETRG